MLKINIMAYIGLLLQQAACVSIYQLAGFDKSRKVQVLCTLYMHTLYNASVDVFKNVFIEKY